MQAKAYILAISVSVAMLSAAEAQRVLGPMGDPPPMRSAPSGAPMAAPPSAAAPSAAMPAPGPATKVQDASCKNPNALGVARVVEIDTTGGPGFGFQHFKN